MLRVRCIAVLAMVLSACSFDRADHAQACESDRDCAAAARCYEGFCLEREPESPACTQSNQIESCYEGEPPESAGVGSCQAGQRFCVDGEYSECLGQVRPGEEICNGRDDDCDGDIDEASAALLTCNTPLPGECSRGARMCREGIEYCQPANESQTESCNGLDDDCDDATDELLTGMCYPQDEAGCTLDTQGRWDCKGLCTTGQAACDAASDTCVGAITPVTERCTEDGAFAQDEDCDDAIDEICPCTGGAVRDCYAGPIGTEDEGVCRPGTQTCEGSAWGECRGQTLPSAETCQNPDEDNDCNGVEDDVPGRGQPCIASSEQGECRNGTLECTDASEPECVAGEANDEICDELDQDCDGDPINGFDLNTSELHCGGCNRECSSSDTCCNGTCVDPDDFQKDEENCGACGISCGAGRYCCQGECLSATGPMNPECMCASDCGDKACCGDNCRNLETDKSNCGACGRKCGRDEDCVSGTCRR
jgi:hypothetical protein